VRNERAQPKEITCSFCYKSVPNEQATGQFVAGAEAYICRGCVEICVDVFSSSDPGWRDLQIARLKEIRRKVRRSN
jgi:hypothetical protein